MEKKKVILAVSGIFAVIFLAIAIMLHGHGMGGYGMRGYAPHTFGHGGWGYHHQ